MECVSAQPRHTAIVTGRALTMDSKPERKRRAIGAIFFSYVQLYNKLYN